jgi:hypothetical protein
MDVFLHPFYNVPTPFIHRVWKESGELLDLETFQSVLDTDLRLDSVDESQSGSGVESSGDHRVYHFGRLMPDTHPISGSPCWSLHTCILSNIMDRIQGGDGLHIEANMDGTAATVPQQDPLYLLNWLTLVGPHCGLRISPKDYQDMVMALQKDGDSVGR